MERNEISSHEARLFLALQDAGKWLTSKEVAKAAGVAEVFPAHRYRLPEKAMNEGGRRWKLRRS